MPQKIVKGYKALLAEAERHVETVSPSEALERQKAGAVLVDLRDPRELEREGEVPGAFHCPRGMLEFWIDPESPYHKPVFAGEGPFVFLCGGGWRSALSAQVAQEMGLKPVAHVGGGFAAWKKAHLPIRGGKPKEGAETVEEQARKLCSHLVKRFDEGDMAALAALAFYPFLTSDARASYVLDTPDALGAHMDMLRSYLIDLGCGDFRIILCDAKQLSPVFVRCLLRLSFRDGEGVEQKPVTLGFLLRLTADGLRVAALADHEPEVTGFAFFDGEDPANDPQAVTTADTPQVEALLARFRAMAEEHMAQLTGGRYGEWASSFAYPCLMSLPDRAGILADAGQAASAIARTIEARRAQGLARYRLLECEHLGSSQVFAFMRMVMAAENVNGQIINRIDMLVHCRLAGEAMPIVGIAVMSGLVPGPGII